MFFTKKVLGLDIGTSSVKMAEIDVSKNKAVLQKFGYATLPAGAVVGGEIHDTALVSDVVRRLYVEGGFKRKVCSIGMFGSSVITKKISMPRMDKKLVAEQIRWEAEQYIPIDLDKVSLDYHILNTKSAAGDSQDVLLVAAKHDHIFRYFETISMAGLSPAVLDVSGFALSNCFEFNYGKSSDVVALVNVGAGVTNFVVLERGEVVFARDIPMGGAAYTSEIQKEMGISSDEAEALKISTSQRQGVPPEVQASIQTVHEVFAEEISNSFQFYGNSVNGLSISRFFLTGGGASVPGLGDAISQSTGCPYEVLNPLIRISYNPKSFSPDYVAQITPFISVVLGLGLRQVGDS